MPSSFSSHFDRRAEVLLPLVFQVEVERGLEDGVQHALDAVGGGARIGQAGHHLRQLRNRRDADFVPVEERVDQRRERLFGRVVMGVFQAAGEQQVLDHRAPGVRRRRLVVLLQNLVDFGELGGAADGGHGDDSLMSWPADSGSSPACEIVGGRFRRVVGSGRVLGKHLLAGSGPRRSIA